MAVPISIPIGMHLQPNATVQDLEVALLLEGIYQLYGDDFRGYEAGPVRNKLLGFMAQQQLATVSALQEKVMHDPQLADALLGVLARKDQGLLAEPAAFRCLRDVAEPLLRSYPNPNIWLPECSAPEDVFAVAILLEEAGVYEKSLLYATCSNQTLLDKARTGRFELNRVEELEASYLQGGGKASFSKYWSQSDEKGRFSVELGRNIIWSQYNLATDNSFNEFQLIICRNQLVDFGDQLRQRTLALFGDSLAPFGLLFTEPVEQLESAPFSSSYKPVSQQFGIYRWTGRRR